MNHPDMSRCVELVSVRMRALKFFPRSKKSQAAMAVVIHENTSSNHHAELLVRTLLTNFDDWPGPVTVRKVAGQCRPIAGAQPLQVSDLCRHCEGSGLTLDGQPCPLEEASTGAVRPLIQAGAKPCEICRTGMHWRNEFQGAEACV